MGSFGSDAMGNSYGIEAPPAHQGGSEQPPVRYVVVIDSASSGARVARLFLASHAPVAEFDAAAPEIARMTQGLLSRHGATGSEWDTPLAGHSAGERRGAEVYTLAI